MNKEQPPIKEILEKVKYLFGIAFMGFLYGISFLVFLAILLQWTIGIDITEFGSTYRLLFLFWGVCAVGWHLYLQNQEEEKIQEQLDRLKRKETIYNPRPGLMEGKELKEEINPSQNQNTNPQQQPEKGEWEVLMKLPQDVDEPSPK